MDGVVVPAALAGADYLGNQLYQFYEDIGQPQEFAPPERNDHPQQPLVGFAQDQLDPDQEAPRFLLPGTRNAAIGAVRRIPQVARLMGYRDHPWVSIARNAAPIIGAIAGRPEIGEFAAAPFAPLYAMGVSGAIYAFQRLLAAARERRDVDAQMKLAAIAAKYPRIVGRTNFASSGNAPFRSCQSCEWTGHHQEATQAQYGVRWWWQRLGFQVFA